MNERWIRVRGARVHNLKNRGQYIHFTSYLLYGLNIFKSNSLIGRKCLALAVDSGK